MAGAAYLTESAPGIDELYEVGREIEVYRDAGELAAKVGELESDEPRRRRLREAGQRRALGEHSIERTIEKIARQLGIV
jgi:spore maturation protein CgeB